MSYREQYDFWLNDDYFDAATREELRGIAGDEKEIEDRFYKELEFGTGGLRGVIGAKSDPGSCQLYYQAGRKRQGGCHRLRLQKKITRVCG